MEGGGYQRQTSQTLKWSSGGVLGIATVEGDGPTQTEEELESIPGNA
jgi:hypothetical protein